MISSKSYVYPFAPQFQMKLALYFLSLVLALYWVLVVNVILYLKGSKQTGYDFAYKCWCLQWIMNSFEFSRDLGGFQNNLMLIYLKLILFSVFLCVLFFRNSNRMFQQFKHPFKCRCLLNHRKIILISFIITPDTPFSENYLRIQKK